MRPYDVFHSRYNNALTNQYCLFAWEDLDKLFASIWSVTCRSWSHDLCTICIILFITQAIRSDEAIPISFSEGSIKYTYCSTDAEMLPWLPRYQLNLELASAHKKPYDYREYFTHNNRAFKTPRKQPYRIDILIS